MYQLYSLRFVGRIMLLATATYFLFNEPSQLDFINYFGFFDGIQFIDFLWMIFMAGLISEFFPRRFISIGSEKQFALHYRSNGHKKKELTSDIKNANLRAFIMLLVWIAPNLMIGFLYKNHIFFTKEWLLWFCLFYYVADLICVLFFCPFQFFIMQNRCCVTCRVFKWDSLMTFTPLFFINSHFGISLIFVSAALGFLWEYRYYKYPERFFEKTNESLRCSQCTTYMCRSKLQRFKPKKEIQTSKKSCC
ncbi:MAG: hypothetical protein UHS41_08955 [Lachnospiraceae bacterium]|nr:hypothetical protein [Lachnospiraceae bacterium]